MNFGRLGRFHARQFERIKAGSAVVEKQKIGSGPARMAGINALILAVQNPEAVENGWHARHLGGLAECVYDRLSIVQGNASKGPDVCATGTPSNTVPTIDEILMTGARRSKGPGLGAFGIIPRSRVKRIYRRQTGWASENGPPLRHFVIAT